MKNILIAIVLVLTSSCSPRTPEKMFNAIFDEKYDSIEMIEGQDQMPFDCCIWLHFKISQTDFDILFKDFVEKETDYNQWNGFLPPGMEWWKPEGFKNKGKYIEKISEDSRITEGVYYNSSKTEIYYVNWYN